jgi:hypothetical protein
VLISVQEGTGDSHRLAVIHLCSPLCIVKPEIKVNPIKEECDGPYATGWFEPSQRKFHCGG